MTISVISKIFYMKKKLIFPNVKKTCKIPFQLIFVQTKCMEFLRSRKKSEQFYLNSKMQ